MAVTGRKYEMTARADAALATAERIVDAAIEVFWERPTHQISLEEVARRAGVTKQTVLRRFGSKDGLMAAAGERAIEEAGGERAGAVPGDLRGAVHALVGHYERMGDRVMRLLAEENRNPGLQEIADRGRGYHAAECERVFAAALDGLPHHDRQRRLAQFIAVCDVYTWKLLRRDRGLSRAQTERALLELLEPMIGGSR